ncbi:MULTISPECIES: hypothetical protein [unclassified Pseudonocardia]|uniref:hypothetical protein n=1 Tax=unclassified Pseudonocardia TaxID=2619320 RepID=UPI000B030D1A|nr:MULTISPECIES: hypothetical protein [unclassified Pseudonocardia]
MSAQWQEPPVAGPSVRQSRRGPVRRLVVGNRPSAPATVTDLTAALGDATRRGAGPVPVDRVDVEESTAAAARGYVAGTAPDPASTAARMGAAAAAMTALDLPAGTTDPVSWNGFGALIPVLSGSPGAGASVVAAALADALQLAGRCVLIVDAADPARSGLAAAAEVEGPWTSALTPDLSLRFSWRGQALLTRLESTLPVITPGMVPPPPQWLPELDPLHVTVVDVGHDGWRAAANPLAGPGGWLRLGTPAQRPLLVVRPTRPSLRHAEQVLARLESWVAAGAAVNPYQLVVVGAKRWPPGVAGAAGRRLEPMTETAVFVPHDDEVQVAGVTAELLPDRLLDAVTPLLTRWNLLPGTAGRPRRRLR